MFTAAFREVNRLHRSLRRFKDTGVCDNWPTHLVQHHVTDGRETLRLLDAGGDELEAQQEVPVVLALPTVIGQVWIARI